MWATGKGSKTESHRIMLIQGNETMFGMPGGNVSRDLSCSLFE